METKNGPFTLILDGNSRPQLRYDDRVSSKRVTAQVSITISHLLDFEWGHHLPRLREALEDMVERFKLHEQNAARAVGCDLDKPKRIENAQFVLTLSSDQFAIAYGSYASPDEYVVKHAPTQADFDAVSAYLARGDGYRLEIFDLDSDEARREAIARGLDGNDFVIVDGHAVPRPLDS